MMEMRVAIAKLIWHYDFQLVSEEQNVPAFNHRDISAGQLELRVRHVKERADKRIT